MSAKSITCQIKYDGNIDGIYYSGDLLSGTVTLTLTKSKNVRGISLTILGQAQSKWTTGSGRNRETHTGKESYLDSVSYLLGAKNGPAIDIEPGTYNYTFACVLPPLLPTSFEHEIGSIKYTVTVNLDRVLRFDDTFTVLFTVLKRVDLNYESPELRWPVGVTQNKSLYCCCIPYGKMNITVSIPQQGYAPRQSIDVDVYLSGDTQDVHRVKIKLKKTLIFNSDSGVTEVKTETLANEQAVEVSSHIKTNLIVPFVPPTLDVFSKIIQITYQVVVTICVSGPHLNPDVVIPIRIGTMPLVGDDMATALPARPSPSAALINHNYDDPPPYDAMNLMAKN